MKLYLASGNAHKAQEFQALADSARVDLEVFSAKSLGGMPPVVEDAGTFEGNARKKARALRERVPAGAWTLADDSGLCVDALGGGPGVESAYFAGPAGDSAANLRKLVEVMAAVPDGLRQAHFYCVLLLIDPHGNEHVFAGRCEGRLAHEPRGGGGFGYDPLFLPNGYTQSLAELGAAVKNEISHRGVAWSHLVQWLRSAGR